MMVTDKHLKKKKTHQHPSWIKAAVFLTCNQVLVNDDTFDFDVSKLLDVPTKIQHHTSDPVFKVCVAKQWVGPSVMKAPLVSLPEICVQGPQRCLRTAPGS